MSLKVLHLTTHINSGGITNYILSLAKPLQSLGCEISVLSSGGELTEIFEDQKIPVFQLPIKTKNELHPRLYFAIPKIIQIIRKNKITLLHAHTRITQVLAYWINRTIHIPYVTTCHGFYKYHRLGRRILPAWGNRVIAISQPVADHLSRDFHVPTDQICTINNGVNLTEIDHELEHINPSEARQEFGLTDRNLVVGVVARIVQDKGHEYLIRAIAELAPKYPDLRLLIVGDGNFRPSLEKLCRDLSIGPNVIFTKTLSNKQVLRALCALDIFALPATWREGFGLSIVEAMACSKPVIVTNIWALNSLVQNDITGILIEPKKVEPLANAIERFIQEPETRKRIGNAGRKMTEEFFSVTRMAKEILDLYKTVSEESAASLKKNGSLS